MTFPLWVMKWSHRVAIAALIIPAVARADVVTINAVKDAMIIGNSDSIAAPKTPNGDTGNASGNGPGLFVGADGNGSKKRSLLQFDVAGALPHGVMVTGVALSLSLAQVAGTGGPNGGGSLPTRIIHLYDVLQPWTEGSSGSPTSGTLGNAGGGYARLTGDTSWDYASFNAATPSTGLWTDGSSTLHGGNIAGTESAESSFSSFLSPNVPFTWSSVGMVNDVQHWLDGSVVNNGWLLRSELETTAASFLAFWSREGAAANGNPAIAPSLTITFTPAPEPATVLLLAAPLALLLVRRTRA